MILVFAGAGGSTAVDPEQYPTTVEFFKRLPEDIKQDALFVRINEFLEKRKKEKSLDIEKILWNLDEIQNYCRMSLDPETIVGWAMEGHLIHHLIPNVPDSSPLRQAMSTLAENQMETLKDRINTQVYNFYATPPDPQKLSDWVQLFKGLADYDLPIEIFTTNYDRVLERVITEAKIDVASGLKRDHDQMVLDVTLWDSPGQPLEDNSGRLTKLHGSVNWQRSDEGIIIGSPIFTGNHQNHPTLYPGYKGEPNQEPFSRFHEHLRAVVSQADMAIFVGFASRDSYINGILSGLSQDIPKFVINKGGSPPDFLALGDQEYSENGLTADSVETCLRSLRQQEARLSLEHANTKITSGDYKAAVADYDRAIALTPQNDEAYHNRGEAKAALGDHQGAITDYDKAIAINPQNATAYTNRGGAKRATNDHQAAIADYDKAIEINPRNAITYSNRGDAKEELGDHQAAITDYDKAIEINPRRSTTYNNRGVAKAALGDRQAAIADYDKAIEINPQNFTAYNNRGATKTALGDHQGAAKDSAKASAIKRKLKKD